MIFTPKMACHCDACFDRSNGWYVGANEQRFFGRWLTIIFTLAMQCGKFTASGPWVQEAGGKGGTGPPSFLDWGGAQGAPRNGSSTCRSLININHMMDYL